MRRRTFDILMSGAGLLIAILLVVAGGLLTWSHSFITDEIHNQLSSQKIFFPAADSDAVKGDEFKAMRQYGGQQLVNGAQAKVYADHFIAVHLNEIAGGKTYSEVSAAAQADPDNAQLAAQVQTLFRGTTLRGMLLNAYAFWKIGQIAMIAAIVSFIGAAVLFFLSIFGFVHARRVGSTAEIFDDLPGKSATPTPATA